MWGRGADHATYPSIPDSVTDSESVHPGFIHSGGGPIHCYADTDDTTAGRMHINGASLEYCDENGKARRVMRANFMNGPEMYLQDANDVPVYTCALGVCGVSRVNVGPDTILGNTGGSVVALSGNQVGGIVESGGAVAWSQTHTYTGTVDIDSGTLLVPLGTQSSAEASIVFDNTGTGRQVTVGDGTYERPLGACFIANSSGYAGASNTNKLSWCPYSGGECCNSQYFPPGFSTADSGACSAYGVATWSRGNQVANKRLRLSSLDCSLTKDAGDGETFEAKFWKTTTSDCVTDQGSDGDGDEVNCWDGGNSASNGSCAITGTDSYAEYNCGNGDGMGLTVAEGEMAHMRVTTSNNGANTYYQCSWIVCLEDW
jgi:hypothetical protein